MRTAAYKQRYAHARPVGDIMCFNCRVVHGRPPLQVQNAGFDFFGFAHVPEVFAQVAAGTAGYVHQVMVFVAAVRAFPFQIVVDDNFAVEAAHMAVVRSWC